MTVVPRNMIRRLMVKMLITLVDKPLDKTRMLDRATNGS